MHPLAGCLPQWTSALQTHAKTGQYAGCVGTATRASACRASRVLTVRLMWMSVLHSPAGTEPPVWTGWAGSPVCVLLGLLVSGQNCTGSPKSNRLHHLKPKNIRWLYDDTFLGLCIFKLLTYMINGLIWGLDYKLCKLQYKRGLNLCCPLLALLLWPWAC